MADSARGRLASSALLLLYPAAVFIGLRYLDPRWLALLLVLVVGWRLVSARSTGQLQASLVALVAAALGTTAITLVTGSSFGLLLYPVLVNCVLLAVFAVSLARPPSAIELVARLREPDLPSEAVRYTRRVTQVWTLFFALNGTIALATVFGDQRWWLLYNGFIAYLLMGALLAGEWLVRRRIRGAHG
ncbi:MAG: hypothetical protein M0Q49_00075 [Porticoccaceae bacterium]|nr:hypothetical protein [Porticoccaceae bacterium]